MNLPLFSFGVITDIQYADIPDGKSFGGVPRFYRHSLEILRRAVKDWQERGNLSFAFHLGDIIDLNVPKDLAKRDLETVLTEFEKLACPTYHMIGNHCVTHLTRTELEDALRFPPRSIPSHPSDDENRYYYDFSPHEGFRFVALDSYDLSTLAWPEGHPKHDHSLSLLRANNKNSNLNAPPMVPGYATRWVAWNGGVGEKQLEWLKLVLEDAQSKGQKAVVFSHVCVYPDPWDTSCLLWNYEEVLRILNGFDCVVATLCGHKHQGSTHVDKNKVVHRVFEAALEARPGTDAFGTVHVYQDRIVVEGSGELQSGEFMFRK